MQIATISPQPLNSATIHIPSSKSHSLRALYFAMLSHGTSTLYNLLDSEDVRTMKQVVTSFGATIKEEKGVTYIKGIKGQFSQPPSLVYAQNSGIIYRFFTALASTMEKATLITGDESIKSQRPIIPLLEALKQVGVKIAASAFGKAPFFIQGPWQSNKITVEGSDSQYVSALLYSAILQPEPVTIYVKNPKELPWLDLSCYWLKMRNIPLKRNGYYFFQTEARASIQPFSYVVTQDMSSASFFIALALIAKVEITLAPFTVDHSQGDKAILQAITLMGATYRLQANALTIYPPSRQLSGIDFDLDSCVDAICILAVLACFASSPSTFVNIQSARGKESNRVEALQKELQKMGANIEVEHNKMTVFPSILYGAALHSHQDQRMAMALTIAAVGAKGVSEIHAVECAAKTFPTFFEEIKKTGANIEVTTEDRVVLHKTSHR